MSLDKGLIIPISEQPISIPKTDLSEPLSHGTLISQNENLMRYLGTSIKLGTNTRLDTNDGGIFYYVTHGGRDVALINGDIQKLGAGLGERQMLEVIIELFTECGWESYQLDITFEEYCRRCGLQPGRKALARARIYAERLNALRLPCKSLINGKWHMFDDFKDVIRVSISRDGKYIRVKWGREYYDYERLSLGKMYIPRLAQTISGRLQQRGERAHDVLVFAAVHKHVQGQGRGKLFDGRQLADILTGEQLIEEAARIIDAETARNEAKAKGKRVSSKLIYRTVEPVRELITDTRSAIIFIPYDKERGEVYRGEELEKHVEPDRVMKLNFYAEWVEHPHGDKLIPDGRLKEIPIKADMLTEIDELVREERRRLDRDK